MLTEAGAAFLEHARRILFEVEDATKELGDSPSLGRRITVGAIPTLAPFLLPPLIARCRERYPNLQISVQENFRLNLASAVIEGEIDLAILALPIDDPRIHVETLLREPLLLAVSKDHPLAKKPRVTAADLASQVFVMLGSSSSLTEQVQNFCGDHHFEPRIGFRCAQIATVKAFVALGAGVSILPRVVRAPEDEGSLVYVTLTGAEPTRELAVIRHVQRYQSRGSEQFLSVLRERAGELVAG